MAGRTIAIGDIHGCSEALRAVLQAMDPKTDDTIVTLGDYIDRGSESRDVVDQVLALSERCELVPLLGNHELMLLIAKENPSEQVWWESVGGEATLLSYRVEKDDASGADGDEASDSDSNSVSKLDWIPQSHLDFFESCVLAYETESHIFVHANYEAKIPISEQNEDVLLWQHLSPSQIPERHLSGKQVIVGHTPQPAGEILDLGHLICIDTHCFGDGWLTALEVDSGQIWQANKAGELRE